MNAEKARELIAAEFRRLVPQEAAKEIQQSPAVLAALKLIAADKTRQAEKEEEIRAQEALQDSLAAAKKAAARLQRYAPRAGLLHPYVGVAQLIDSAITAAEQCAIQRRSGQPRKPGGPLLMIALFGSLERAEVPPRARWKLIEQSIPSSVLEPASVAGSVKTARGKLRKGKNPAETNGG
ncbi:hypothetical protein [Inhella sp.]|uniref:hypothetical protein n=1 Tax=Inhella sp. TaxID=1921806 RepID=UPI0035B2FECC